MKTRSQTPLHDGGYPGRKEDIVAAEQTIQDIKRVNFKVGALVHLAEAQAARGNTETAWQTLKQAQSLIPVIANPLQKPEAFADITVAQARMGDPKAAQQTAQGTGAAKEKAMALAGIAAVQAHEGNIQAAQATLAAAQQTVQGETTPFIKAKALIAMVEQFYTLHNEMAR